MLIFMLQAIAISIFLWLDDYFLQTDRLGAPQVLSFYSHHLFKSSLIFLNMFWEQAWWGSESKRGGGGGTKNQA